MKLAIFAVLIAATLCAAEKSKRQIFPGYGLGYGGFGYGYGGFGYPGFGYPGVGIIGRKRRDVESHVDDEETKEKRQIFPGYGLGYGGIGYGGFGYGYPGVVGVGYPAVGGFYGRKRRDVDEVSEHIKEKRQIGFFPGYGYGGFGYGGLGYGGAINTGFGFPAIYGRKRRDTEDVESHKDKRQVLLGGVGYPAFGYGGLGYGGFGYGAGFGYPAIYGRKRRDTDDVEHHEEHKEKRQILAGGLIGSPVIGGFGYGYPGYGFGYGAVNTGFGYPAIYGRKRRDTEDVEHHEEHKEKRQILVGGPVVGGFGYGYPGYGFGYGAVNTGFGFPAIYGRKRRDTEDVEHHEEHKEKRQILAAGYAPVIGAAPIVGPAFVGAPVVAAPFVGGFGYHAPPVIL